MFIKLVPSVSLVFLVATGCMPAEPTAESCAKFLAEATPTASAATTPAGAATTPASPTATAPATPASTASSEGHVLTDAEYSLLSDAIDAVRTGVAPQGPATIGICKPDGRKCGEFLGTEADLTEPGDYIVYAEFKVPKVGPIDGNKWQITFDTECVATSASGESTTTNSKEWKVQYSGSDDRGYTLSPLWTIKSPTGRDTRCSYKVSMPKAGGENLVSGYWTTPGK